MISRVVRGKPYISRSFYWPNGGSLCPERHKLSVIAWHVWGADLYLKTFPTFEMACLDAATMPEGQRGFLVDDTE